ncbi:uncharacterized protein LY79DRAFT_132242 [Colletotrichum navitas]|uniref:Uncharacterized protein n=1 Tax=Colletotrichum navitas TaxID=681940 RepID=A0AAD8Q493_9PEZI|nr:uncharacterized protein LY79DRAFT_132242 [Colletotrichum navitas]KAK1594554.1 hypothetical protein LY79DRAFT_132242 [Colletotrichum navitas]
MHDAGVRYKTFIAAAGALFEPASRAFFFFFFSSSFFFLFSFPPTTVNCLLTPPPHADVGGLGELLHRLRGRGSRPIEAPDSRDLRPICVCVCVCVCGVHPGVVSLTLGDVCVCERVSLSIQLHLSAPSIAAAAAAAVASVLRPSGMLTVVGRLGIVSMSKDNPEVTARYATNGPAERRQAERRGI